MVRRTTLLTCLLIGILTIALSAALSMGSATLLGDTSMLSAQPVQSANTSSTSMLVDNKASKLDQVRSVEFAVETGELTTCDVDNDMGAAQRAVQDEDSVFEKCDHGSLDHRPQD